MEGERMNVYLNNKQAAEFLGVTEGTLAVWRTTRRYAIPYVKVGSLIRYKKADLEQWLEQRTVREVEND